MPFEFGRGIAVGLCLVGAGVMLYRKRSSLACSSGLAGRARYTVLFAGISVIVSRLGQQQSAMWGHNLALAIQFSFLLAAVYFLWRGANESRALR